MKRFLIFAFMTLVSFGARADEWGDLLNRIYNTVSKSEFAQKIQKASPETQKAYVELYKKAHPDEAKNIKTVDDIIGAEKAKLDECLAKNAMNIWKNNKCETCAAPKQPNKNRDDCEEPPQEPVPEKTVVQEDPKYTMVECQRLRKQLEGANRAFESKVNEVSRICLNENKKLENAAIAARIGTMIMKDDSYKASDKIYSDAADKTERQCPTDDAECTGECRRVIDGLTKINAENAEVLRFVEEKKDDIVRELGCAAATTEEPCNKGDKMRVDASNTSGNSGEILDTTSQSTEYICDENGKWVLLDAQTPPSNFVSVARATACYAPEQYSLCPLRSCTLNVLMRQIHGLVNAAKGTVLYDEALELCKDVSTLCDEIAANGTVADAHADDWSKRCFELKDLFASKFEGSNTPAQNVVLKASEHTQLITNGGFAKVVKDAKNISGTVDCWIAIADLRNIKDGETRNAACLAASDDWSKLQKCGFSITQGALPRGAMTRDYTIVVGNCSDIPPDTVTMEFRKSNTGRGPSIDVLFKSEDVFKKLCHFVDGQLRPGLDINGLGKPCIDKLCGGAYAQNQDAQTARIRYECDASAVDATNPERTPVIVSNPTVDEINDALGLRER